MNDQVQSASADSVAGQPATDEYRLVLESFAQAFWQTDETGKVVEDSPSWCAYTGQTREQWLSQGWLSAIHPDERSGALQQWQQTLRSRLPFDTECRLQRAGGGWRWTNVRATAIHNSDGSIRKWVGLAIDITQKKQAEEALINSEERFRAFVTATSDAVYRMSADWHRMHQLVGKSFLLDTSTSTTSWLEQHIPLPDQARVQAAIDKAIENKSLFELAHRVIQSDGSLGWTFSRAIPILNQQGEIIEWFGTASDITERKEAQEMVRRNEERQAFLLHLSDTLQPLTDPLDIQAAAADLLGTHLGVDQAYYGEVRGGNVSISHVYREELPPLTGPFHADHFGKRLLEGYRSRTSPVCFDTTTDPLFSAEERQALARAHIGAYLSAPLVKAGEWVGTLAVQHTEPREWTPSEIELVQEVAERTWAVVERARAEAALRKSETRFRLAIEATEMATWEWNLESNEVYWNEHHFRLFGLECQSQPVSPETFVNHVHPDDRERVTALLQQAIDQRGAYNTEFCTLLPDGSQRWMSGYGRVIEEVNGKPVRMSGVMFDVTERRRTEDALHRSEARLRAILDSAKDYAIFTTNLDRRVTSWNPGAQIMFAYTEEEILYQSADQLFTPEDRQHTDGLPNAPEMEAQKAISEGQAENERWHSRQDGSRFYGSGLITSLRDETGSIVGLVKVMRDLTAQKQAAEALQEANQRKDEFLAMLAHELRNPMATISNGLQILTLTSVKDQDTGPPGSRDVIAMMSRQVDHLVRMVDDLLDVSRISRGKIELKQERLELGKLVAAAVDAIRPSFEANKKSLRAIPFPLALFVQGDATRLTQVVTNLLTNGLRYTGPQGQVWLNLAEANGEVQLRVTDNGIGLSADQLTAIFELFVQADHSLARSLGGLGVGLTLARRLVELHKGRLDASSPGLGKGSTFTVYLPLAETPESKPATAVSVPSSTTTRVLVIDDNADAALTLSMLLTLKGYDVHSRSSGREGIQAAESLQPAVVFCDIGMPDLDGYATCRLIREQWWGQSMRLIALTGYGQAEDKQRAQEAGFDGHLIKPVDLGALLALLTNVLSTDPPPKEAV